MGSQLEAAHKHSIFNKAEVLASTSSGCFYCLHMFSPVDIKDWIEENNKEETALCPYCGIDAVLGCASGYPVSDITFLETMNKRWFN
jgi:Zn finger protein HypA/HybF involved in hydrogenase expression